MNELRAILNRMLMIALTMTIVGVGVSSVAVAAPMCAEMFSEQAKLTSHSETRYSFLPEHVRLIKTSDKEYSVDYVYNVKGRPRLKRVELAMDFANVIDANLNSGRELLNTILNYRKEGKPSGTYIFIDVNNLGWVNKNFADKMQSGDLYLFKTMAAIQRVVGKDGLVFRLGGDEFGIVLEAQEPQAVQKIMQNLQRDIHAKAHSVFLAETQRRVDEIKKVHQKRKQGLISESEYQEAMALFRTYTSYSQEGVSMGAAYLDGSPAEVIQNRAEKMATEMKIKIKQAFNLDTSKYTGGVNFSNSENKIQILFRPDIPQIMSQQQFNQFFPHAQKTDVLRVKNRTAWYSAVSPIKNQRTHVIARFGHLGIAKYRSELATEEYRLEYYNTSQQVIETHPLELNGNTGFMDARSRAAKAMINHYLERVSHAEQDGGTIWVSLLNLGKLNYFHKKTATGDQALRLAAQILRKELTVENISFKENGSDFLILTLGLNKEQIASYKNILEDKLNSNALLDEVFLQEIQFIKQTEQDPQMRDNRIDEIRKLMVNKFKVF